MSNAEHLIENAICVIERGGSFEDFANASHNKEMSDTDGVRLETVWDMAQYVIYTYRENLAYKVEEEMRKLLDFDVCEACEDNNNCPHPHSCPGSYYQKFRWRGFSL